MKVYAGNYVVTHTEVWYNSKFGVVDFVFKKSTDVWVIPGKVYKDVMFAGRVCALSDTGKTKGLYSEDHTLFISSLTSSNPYIELSGGDLVVGPDWCTGDSHQYRPVGSGLPCWGIEHTHSRDEWLSSIPRENFISPRHLKYGDIESITVDSKEVTCQGVRAVQLYLGEIRAPIPRPTVKFRVEDREFWSVNHGVINRPDGVILTMPEVVSSPSYICVGDVVHDFALSSGVWIPGAKEVEYDN